MTIKPKSNKKITPETYYSIAFECSNRQFRAVLADLWEISNKIGIELQDGYMSEKCDYEGDLERIIIYNNERSKTLVDAVLVFYGVKDKIGDVNIVLEIFNES